MDQASGLVESRERAVSSEPCSTRPNPFDDSDISSRKRRRTSLSGASTTRSVGSVDSHQHSPAGNHQRDESDMNLDTDPTTTPQTPEQQHAQQSATDSRPQVPGERSSRVTINVRTPSRPLDVIPSSPPSPPSPTPRPAASAPGDSSPLPGGMEQQAVRPSVEDMEAEIPQGDAPSDTPVSSSSESGSPPVEVINVQLDDEYDFDHGQAAVGLLQSLPPGIVADPSPDFPYRDHAELYPEAIVRLTQFLPTHESVSRDIAQWIELCLAYLKGVTVERAQESIKEFHDLWYHLPELVMFMVSRKMAYPRGKLWQEIMVFYASFSRLTALFIEHDLRNLAMHGPAAQQTQLPELLSLNYIQAFASLTRREEVLLHSGHLHNGDPDCDYAVDTNLVLAEFQKSLRHRGGPVAHLKELAYILAALAPQFPKITEALAYLGVLVDTLLRDNARRNAGREGESDNPFRNQIARGYQFFEIVSSALSNIIEKHVNHLTYDGAATLVSSLTEIYQICLATEGIVPSALIDSHLLSHPPIAASSIPEAMASHWKFTTFSKLIMSSQMQLRVMAVSSMCNDLVAFWRKFNDLSDETNRLFLQYIADFLLRTGLVTYILGPTCHPEITTESSNIVGFLLVSTTYTNEHTDALWQTVTSTQDPRVSDALIRMASRITNLFSYDGLIYLCEKLHTVPVEAFGPSMRDFFESILRQLLTKHTYDRPALDGPPYGLCVRLLRLSSTFGPQSPTAYQDLQHFAIQKFKELLGSGPSLEGRRDIYLSCLGDIAEKSPSALGSLWVLSLMLKPYNVRADLRSLTVDHGLTRLLVEEMEAAIPLAKRAGFPAVISGIQNTPRKDLITCILYHEPETVTKELGPRLWDVLVGSGAACQEDRDVAWQIFNTSLKKVSARADNPFISTCFSEYLPTLAPQCFCSGALEFVREELLPLVNEPTSIILDDSDSFDRIGIEQLWRMILTAPENTIEQLAIHTLVSDIYVDSQSIISFPHYRARKVHLALVDRCLSQLSSAAAKLKEFNDGVASGDEESMVIVATEQQTLEQELLFIRSLAVLREFHRLHQVKSHFSAPDLRSLILESPNDVDGESAELKYQSFDGDQQTDVMPLNIGKRNTAASLLASLREATGFTNYRIYYRGRPFVPREDDICKSLEDLQIHNGIILVKREFDAPTSPTARARPGASPVDIEILGSFEEFWDYLTMEEKLAQEIYSFLVKLPVDDHMLRAIRQISTSYKDIFPLGQPFKCLYGAHVLGDYIASSQRRPANPQPAGSGPDAEISSDDLSNSLARVMSLVVAAIADPEVLAQCGSDDLQVEFSFALLDCFMSLLEDTSLPVVSSELLDGTLLDRLVAILSLLASPSNTSKLARKQVHLALRSILECCSKNDAFWTAFCCHEALTDLLGDFLLNDERIGVREDTVSLIQEKIRLNKDPDDNGPSFQVFFWPLVSTLIASTPARPDTCKELFNLCIAMFDTLRATQPTILDLAGLLKGWISLLLDYTTFEDITQPGANDVVAYGFIQLVHHLLCSETYPVDPSMLPRDNVARKLFWKHLFPPFEKEPGTDAPTDGHHPILYPPARNKLVAIVFALVGDDRQQLMYLLRDLDELVPFDNDEDGDFYAYELQPQFERNKAIRTSCGYVGLKNLSNTCYLNSLITQLFMNIEFRQFIINADVNDRDYGQNLLFQTQNLFGYMQGSIRRFVNPEDCVFSIKTYEDTQIDIHNQMDVDEFYNLLFDRWEGQLHGADEKREFRSFYGGQLVQQVSSQECEHISERLEPFSAIQCDIKGKNSLEESLQAYVDGEIMAGDNKYKCSSCDRHVDAVKRACLKDIPDNLIFHLKRFDFNLRTLQRSKINDYFTFPSKIDMRPYTIDHLSQLDEEVEDIFELVGVLVHSGTAESGHYYSFIRERPTSGDSQAWVEFNDDMVTSWDPALMESSCFGGPDYRPNFENTGVLYDKNYSAYMLFYQRSTLLAKEHALLRPGLPSPLQVELPAELGAHIARENASLLRRHCLYDPGQIVFVRLALARLKKVTQGECTRAHKAEDLAIQMALSHLDQVASRAKDVPDFMDLIQVLSSMSESCARCSSTVVKYFGDRHPSLRWLVQRNPEQNVRQQTATLVIRALRVIREHDPFRYGLQAASSNGEDDDEEPDRYGSRTVVHEVLGIFKHLLERFEFSLRSWPEVFGFMLSFVNLGRYETAMFLETNFLYKLILIIYADSNLEMPQQFAKLAATVARRMANRPPSYENIISLLDVLMSSLDFPNPARPDVGIEHYGQRLEVENNEDLEGFFYYTAAEAKLLTRDWGRGQACIFLEKLIGLNQNLAATHSIIGGLMDRSTVMEEKVFRTLRHSISGQITANHSTPYLRVAIAYCRKARDPELIHKLITHVSTECLCIHTAEGRAFYEFQVEAFYGMRENSSESREDILIGGLEHLSEWAPGLLGYFDASVSNDVEELLQEMIFKHGIQPSFEDAPDSARRADATVDAARDLGMRCLTYLRDNYVSRRLDVTPRMVEGLERVIKQCAEYFNLKQPSEDPMAADFLRLSQNVLEPLSRLTVAEDLEEEGSEWENSSDISGRVDSLGDINLPTEAEPQ